MKRILQKLRAYSHQLLTGAFIPLADYQGSKLSKVFNNDENLVQYLNTLFKFAITVGAILAVLRMLYAGYVYMASDVWTSKETAKGIFRDVFLGLFLLLSIYIILSQINPNLLNLNPQITAITPQTQAGPAGTAPAITPSTGCSGCVPIPAGVPSKPPGTVSGSSACRASEMAPGATQCLVSPTMASKLRALAIATASMSSWQVTEAYPPTVAHSGPASCHNNGLGTCVDIGLFGSTPVSIISFINAARGVGLTAVWEVPTQARRQVLMTGGVPNASIWVTGASEHFHVTGG